MWIWRYFSIAVIKEKDKIEIKADFEIRNFRHTKKDDGNKLWWARVWVWYGDMVYMINIDTDNTNVIFSAPGNQDNHDEQMQISVFEVNDRKRKQFSR